MSGTLFHNKVADLAGPVGIVSNDHLLEQLSVIVFTSLLAVTIFATRGQDILDWHDPNLFFLILEHFATKTGSTDIHACK